MTKSQRLTNSAGTVISWVELDPWGAETGGSSNSQQQPHRYTSYERDANGGDEAMLRRYEGRWQRFSQPDPFGGSYNLSDPQSLNRYTYVQNDPVNFVDPLGLDGQGTTIICFPSPSGPICISSGVGVTVTGGGGGSIAGGGGGSNGFLNLRQRMAGANPEEIGGRSRNGEPQNAVGHDEEQSQKCIRERYAALVQRVNKIREDAMRRVGGFLPSRNENRTIGIGVLLSVLVTRNPASLLWTAIIGVGAQTIGHWIEYHEIVDPEEQIENRRFRTEVRACVEIYGSPGKGYNPKLFEN